MSDLVGNPEDRFSCNAAHFSCVFQRSVLDLKQTYGICMLAETSSCSTAFMSHIKQICFSIVEELNNNNDCPGLFNLGLELMLKIPGALKELLDLVWRAMEKSYKLDTCNHPYFLDNSGN